MAKMNDFQTGFDPRHGVSLVLTPILTSQKVRTFDEDR